MDADEYMRAAEGEDVDHAAIHEAAHAILRIVLGIGPKPVSIVSNLEDINVGAVTHGGEVSYDEEAYALRLLAEDAFRLRHAIACYGGAEAVLQLRPQYDGERREATAAADYRDANLHISSIAPDDPESIVPYVAVAKRRCAVLVKHYAPEIEVLAAALKDRRELPADEAREIVNESILGRNARYLSW